MKPRIAFIGAGSFIFARKIMIDLFSFAEISKPCIIADNFLPTGAFPSVAITASHEQNQIGDEWI